MKQLAEEEEARIMKQIEEEQKVIEEKKKKEKETKLVSLPPEPNEGDKGIIQVVFRLPNGQRIERRFNQTDKLQIAYDFLDSRKDIDIPKYDLM